MAFRLKRFCGLEFLQWIDKHGPLAQPLARHRAHFTGMSTRTGKLANDNAIAGAARLFIQTRESCPANSSRRSTTSIRRAIAMARRRNGSPTKLAAQWNQ
jgi:hypothetical protein